MTITRVFRDGVEFFTIIETGESGMSVSGLARLCAVTESAIRQFLARTSLRSLEVKKWLEALQEKDLDFEDKGWWKQVRVLPSELCAQIIEHYAFESKQKRTAEALYAYRKFATMGIETWIQTITGWQRPPAVPEIITETRLNNDNINLLISEKRPSSIYRLYLHLHSIGQQGQRPTVSQICDRLSISRATYHKYVRRLSPVRPGPTSRLARN
jgi:hypothetical protein